MTFEEWYNDTFTYELWEGPYEVVTEQALMCDAYNAALENSVPKPSTDFTTPMSKPGKSYLIFDKHEEDWFVGYYHPVRQQFLWTAHNLNGDEVLDPSHWLPMPDNP